MAWGRKRARAPRSGPSPKQQLATAVAASEEVVASYSKRVSFHVPPRITKSGAVKMGLFDPATRWQMLVEMAKTTVEAFREDGSPSDCSHPDDGRLRMYFRDDEFVACVLCGRIGEIAPTDPEVARLSRLSEADRIADLARLSADIRDD